ncbi:STAS domain-containing protein [Streptomyces sp. NPDC020875]|uniref:STAS domain-containing protein n=1 Tax=Streptomyces sp. NPDC020875 TaxID=3154898 RepID=UPI0033D49210
MTPLPPARLTHRTLFTSGPGPGTETARIYLGGELDLTTGPDLITAVTMNLTLQPRSLRIDLTGLDFMDSAGLRHLEHAAELAARAGTELVLCGIPRPLVRRLLAHTRTPLRTPLRRLATPPVRPASGPVPAPVRGVGTGQAPPRPRPRRRRARAGRAWWTRIIR